MALFDNREQYNDIGTMATQSLDSQTKGGITSIIDSEALFAQLQSAKDIPTQFLPEASHYCLVISHSPTHVGELSDSVIDQINTFARAHISDPTHARWLLAHTWLSNSVRPQSTLVCFIQHFSPNALVDNTEGAGVANQIVAALQALHEEGLVTTNVNYELIRKMSSRFGVMFGGSFAEVANSLRVHSIDQSVDKSKKVAHEKGLLTPAPAPAMTPSLGGSSRNDDLKSQE